MVAVKSEWTFIKGNVSTVEWNQAPEGQLEVELDGGALVLALKGVSEGDVDLGSVEGAVARIQLPLKAEAVERLGKIFLGLVPHFDVAEEFVGPEKDINL